MLSVAPLQSERSGCIKVTLPELYQIVTLPIRAIGRRETGTKMSMLMMVEAHLCFHT